MPVVMVVAAAAAAGACRESSPTALWHISPERGDNRTLPCGTRHGAAATTATGAEVWGRSQKRLPFLTAKENGHHSGEVPASHYVEMCVLW